MWHCDLCCEQNRPGHVLSPISKWHSRAFIRGTLLSHSYLQARKGGQPKEQHLREGSEETGRAVPKDAGIWALSWGRYSQDKVISFTLSPAFADFRRLCVKFSIFCHLKLKCTAWVLRPYYGKLFGVCFVADSLKFPFAASSCFLFRCASYKPREAAQMYQNGEKRGHSVPQWSF